MTWLLLIAGCFAVSWVLVERPKPRGIALRDERTRVLDAGSLYRLGQRTEQAGLVTGARMRTR
jgi:hypothetical protein